MLKALVLHLAISCSPNVAPETIDQIIHVESGYNEFAVNINESDGKHYPPFEQPEDLPSAVAIVQDALTKGHSADIGLMQINTQNLSWLGLSIIETFDPCINVAAGGLILTQYYTKAVKRMGQGQQALLSALSSYNTGDPLRGFSNGYIQRYINAARDVTTSTNYLNTHDPVDKAAIESDTTITIPEFMKEATLNEDKKTPTEKNNSNEAKTNTDSSDKSTEQKPTVTPENINNSEETLNANPANDKVPENTQRKLKKIEGDDG